MITAITTHRQRRVGGRPSGNSSKVSGRTSPIANGQDQTKIVITSRCTAMGAAASRNTAPSGAASAAVAYATPPAANSQPIGLRGRCQAKMAPQMPKLIPIAEFVTTKASRASCQDHPATPLRTAAAMTSSRTNTPSAAANARSPGPHEPPEALAPGAPAVSYAKSAPNTSRCPGKISRRDRGSSRLGRSLTHPTVLVLHATLKATDQSGRLEDSRMEARKCLLSIAAESRCSA